MTKFAYAAIDAQGAAVEGVTKADGSPIGGGPA